MAFYWKETPIKDRLATLMRERNVTKGELADALSVSRSTISFWLSGKREPKEAHRNGICKVFGIDYLNLIHTKEELAQGNLSFLFRKHNIQVERFERLEELEDEISQYFIENIGKYSKK